MNTTLQNLYNAIESQRQMTMSLIREMTSEELNQRPSAAKWSAGEIISHLITAERLSLVYMKKKIQGVETLKDTGVLEEAKMMLLKISQRLPGLKFRAPKVVVEHTKIYPDFATLEKAWAHVRSELKEFLETIEDNHIQRRVYKHAIVGYLNVQHSLRFFKEHVIHHTPQIKKLVRNTN